MKKIVLPLIFPVALCAQTTVDTTKVDLKEPAQDHITLFDKKASARLLFVGDYAKSFTTDVDMTGKHNPEASDNGFYLKYVRINAKFDISKKLSALVLVNLADFKNDPKSRVLEIASLKYAANPYLNLQVGQFRPYFGLEDMYPAEIMKSNAWSNQYGAMSRSNWQSFQIGAAVFGSLQKNKVPLRYYYTFYNGNGKNQIQDDDDAKNHAFRLEYDLLPKLTLAGNSAFTRVQSQNASMHGIDFQYEQKLSDVWNFDISSDFKYGTNVAAFKSSTLADKKISDFRLTGFYILPAVSRQLNKKMNSFAELSLRYEYLEELKNGNHSNTITPMLSYVVGNDYACKVSLVGIFIDYKNNIPSTSQYSSNIFLLQFQVRY